MTKISPDYVELLPLLEEIFDNCYIPENKKKDVVIYVCKINIMYISVTYFYDKCHGFKCHIYVSVFFFLGWGHWVEFFLIIFLDWGFSHSY